MKVRCVTGFSLGGGRDVYPGDEFELPEPQARLKLRDGSVVEVTAPAVEVEGEPDIIEGDDPEVHHRDPRKRRSH